jgi:hypothetical protein
MPDETDRKKPVKGSNQRAGASVLVAAISLLGTSLGVSAATPIEPLGLGTEGRAGGNPAEPGEQKNLLAANVSQVRVSVPHPVVSHQMKITPPTSHQFKLERRNLKYNSAGHKKQ